MLHDHKYDPNCVFCCDNEFVKNAEKAKADLPYNENILSDLGDSLEIAIQKYEDYGIDTIERNIEKFKELSEDYDSAALNCERSRMSIKTSEATVALLTNEIEDLEAKAKEYEDNRQAIENKEQLYGERSAVEKKIEENKGLLKNVMGLHKSISSKKQQQKK